MSAWWLLPLALAACLAVLAIAACLSPKPRHAAPRRRLDPPAQDFYGSMTLIEEHPERLPDRGAREEMLAGLAPEALDSDVQPDPYLDAIAAEHGSEWEPTEAEEAYMAEHHPTALLGVGPPDSGPGVLSSLPPGPDQSPALAPDDSRHDGQGEGRAFHGLNHADDDWLDRQLAAHVAWVARMAPLVTGWSVAA